MAFDYKKEFKTLYCPKEQPELCDVPEMRFIAVDGRGDPNTPGGAYEMAMNILYSLSYTIKMSYKQNVPIEGFFEYVVPPLEGFWYMSDNTFVNYADKGVFCWQSLIRQPDFVTDEVFSWACAEVEAKKKIDTSPARLITLTEGLCVQALHIGTYDDEPRTVAKMAEYIEKEGYILDISDSRRHHEIYLGDPRKTAPEKRRTIIRHPIKKAD